MPSWVVLWIELTSFGIAGVFVGRWIERKRK